MDRERTRNLRLTRSVPNQLRHPAVSVQSARQLYETAFAKQRMDIKCYGEEWISNATEKNVSNATEKNEYQMLRKRMDIKCYGEE
ncbi:hypothetical protein TNCV_76911 [Trichonephila clavipes]|nr:hypothetical protein TNCV_76911 [Trichonephila clavipes]